MRVVKKNKSNHTFNQKNKYKYRGLDFGNIKIKVDYLLENNLI